MTLARGSRVGPYEIISLRGAGGMGEVYRARDTRLDRTVAVKVLPPTLTDNEELRARFEREARAISALSHPNICALFDVGTDGGAEYLVMEYLEGETLAERLAKGPLPTSLVVRYGAQIAEALQQAHRAGITHRDLKPGNIMITASGAKLLDFGLAKFIEPSSRVFSEHSAPATKVSPLTSEGMVVGTTAYMSPEQLEGKTLDHRTDIFALGVILYEMATGQRPFRGDSAASLIAAILASDPPPMRTLQPSVAPALERIILTALEKNPDERWQTAQDVGRQLRWINDSSVTSAQMTAEQAAPARQRRLRLGPAVAITAVTTALVTFGAAWLVRPPPPRVEAIDLQFAQPDELRFFRSSENDDFTVSPDGRTVAFLAGTGPTNALFLRRLDSYEFRKVEGSDGAHAPFWSSGSDWIGYSANGKLWKTKIAGGAPPEAICDVNPFGARATWVGNTILFSETRGNRPEIYRVASSGGVPAAVTRIGPAGWRDSWPLLLPDGIHFLYLAYAAGSLERTLILASLDSPKASKLVRNISFARIAGGDRLLYVRDGNLLSQTLDIAKGALVDEPVTVATNVSYFYPTGRADFDASPAGVVVFRTDTSSGRLVRLDRKGTVTQTIDGNGLFWDHAIAPDGKKAAVTVVSRGTGLMDIWIYDLTRGTRDRFTSDPAIEVSPGWMPDGKTIIYSQAEGGNFPHLVRRGLAGATSEALTPKGSFQFAANVTRDGESVFYQSDAGKGPDILRLSLKTMQSTPVVATSYSELAPAVSPDGTWLAYTSDATGTMEVYLQSLTPGDPVRVRVSNSGGRDAQWSANGQELFYLGAGKAIMSAVAGPNGRWDEATLTELFHYPGDLQAFAPAPDGQSFLVSDTRVGAADALFHVMTGVR
jgi:Tol biopolymer transport system component